MFHVGLTGNVAAGKTTVADWFSRWGATVVDADTIVRDLQRPGQPVTAAIVEEFGQQILMRDGSLDRDALRRLILADPERRTRLNAIVHPAVADRRAEMIAAAEARGDLIVVSDIPLLFEVMSPDHFDLVVLVDAPVPVRRERLISHRGLSPAEADALIATQAPAEGKRERSQIVLDNDSSLAGLEAAARRAWQRIRRHGAAAVGPPGRLVAVFAHPGDEGCAAGGTLARYVDAGWTVSLLCLTTGAHHAPSATDPSPTNPGVRSLRRSTEALGIREVTVLGYAEGHLPPDDAMAIAEIAAHVRCAEPDVLISFGQDGATGHPDHAAVSALTERAWAAAGKPGHLLQAAWPSHEVHVLPPPLRTRSPDDVTVVIDIRPWANEKREAILASPPDERWYDADGADLPLLFEREWFASPAAPKGRIHHLPGPGDRA